MELLPADWGGGECRAECCLQVHLVRWLWLVLSDLVEAVGVAVSHIILEVQFLGVSGAGRVLGQGITGEVPSAWDVGHPQSVSQRPFFQILESRIRNVLEATITEQF